MTEQIKYFSQIHQAMSHTRVFNQHFGGRMILDKLTPEDRKQMIRFYKMVLKRPLADWERTNPALATEFGQKMTKMIGYIDLAEMC